MIVDDNLEFDFGFDDVHVEFDSHRDVDVDCNYELHVDVHFDADVDFDVHVDVRFDCVL